MASIFELMDPIRQPTIPRPEGDMISGMRRSLHAASSELEASSATYNILTAARSRHSKRINEVQNHRFPVSFFQVSYAPDLKARSSSVLSGSLIPTDLHFCSAPSQVNSPR